MMYRLLLTHVYRSKLRQATDGFRCPTSPPRRLAMVCAALSTDIQPGKTVIESRKNKRTIHEREQLPRPHQAD